MSTAADLNESEFVKVEDDDGDGRDVDLEKLATMDEVISTMYSTLYCDVHTQHYI